MMPAPQTRPATDRRTVDADNPWPGLVSFSEADEEFFQGRQAETATLARLVLRERLTILFGRSGFGKSSLLQAGLFPWLRKQRILPIYIRLDYSPLAPDPVLQVVAAIGDQARDAEVVAPQWRRGETLWEYFHRRDAGFWNRLRKPVTPLLVFDQFEEIFTLGRQDGAQTLGSADLIEQLADLAEGRPPATLKARLEGNPEDAKEFDFGSHDYKLLLALREDFLAELEGLRDRIPSIAKNRLRLRPMNGEAALQVVNQAPHLIDPEVADRVVRFVAAAARSAGDLSELRVEPALLSLFCRELNERRRLAGAAKISEELVTGSQGELLSGFYERSVADLPEAVRNFVEDALLTPSGYRDSVALENAAAAGATSEDIDRLVNRRLVRREEREGIPRLELTHDRLTEAVQASRDERHRREAEEKQRQARVAAEQREREARQQLARSRRLTAAFIVISLLAVGTAIWAVVAERKAKESEEAALSSQKEAYESERLADDRAEAARSSAAEARRQSQLADVERTGALRQKELADQARLSADAERRRAETGQRTAHRALALVHLKDARQLQLGEQRRQALAHLASAVRLAQDDPIVRARGLDELEFLAAPIPNQPLQHERFVTSAAFSPDGRRVVTASGDYTAQVWNADSGDKIGTPLQHEGIVWSAAFSPDSQRVVTASDDRTAQVWDANSCDKIGTPLQHEGPVVSAAFSPDGQRVVTASDDYTAQVWDADSGDKIGTPLQHEGRVVAAAFSPDGRRVVTASHDGTAQIWDADSGDKIGTALKHEGPVVSTAFSPDGRRVVTASDDRTAQVWDAKSGARVGTPLQHEGSISSAAFSPDGRRVVTASDDRTAQVWDADSGDKIGTSLQHEFRVNSATFSPDGRRVVTASGDYTAQVWNADSGAKIGSALQHEGIVFSAVFSPDGRRVATASDDRTAQVWNADSGDKIGTPLQHKGRVVSAAFKPVERRVVTASDDRTAQVWNADSGAKIGSALQHKGIVVSAAFSPDGRRVVTASWDYTAQIWDADSGAKIGTALQHEGIVVAAAFSPDGRRVVTASHDGTAQVWDAASGDKIGTPLQHKGPVVSAAFSPDGRRVVTATRDHTAQVWDAFVPPSTDSLRLADLLEAVGGYRLTELGSLEATPVDERASQLIALHEVGEQAPDHEPTVDSFIRWYFTQPRKRSISPLSKMTVEEYLRRELAIGTDSALQRAWRNFPGHPLLLEAQRQSEEASERSALHHPAEAP